MGNSSLKYYGKPVWLLKGFIQGIILGKEKHSKKTGIFLSAYDLVFYFRTKTHLKLYRDGRKEKENKENGEWETKYSLKKKEPLSEDSLLNL